MGYLIGIIYLMFGAAAFWIERGAPQRAVSASRFAIGHSDVLTAALIVAMLAFALELIGAAHRHRAWATSSKTRTQRAAGRRDSGINSRF